MNRGGDIFNVKITPLSNFQVIICPDNKIKHEESGCIIFRLADSNPPESLSMSIRYANQNAEQKKEVYIFIPDEETVKRIE